MAKWYYYEGDHVKGPVSIGQLKLLHDKGLINRHTQVCKEGESQWSHCHDVLAMIYASTHKRLKAIIIIASICILIAGIISFSVIRHNDRREAEQDEEWVNSGQAKKMKEARQAIQDYEDLKKRQELRRELREDIKDAIRDM